MKQILILTKNCLADQKMQQDLQALDYEVFCSSSLLELLRCHLNVREVMSYFQTVILSESLSEIEVSHVLPILQNYYLDVIRKDRQLPTPEQEAYWRQQGITAWFTPEDTLVDYREKLVPELNNEFPPKKTSERKSSAQIILHKDVIPASRPAQPASNEPSFDTVGLGFVLTAQERRILDVMQQRQTQPVSQGEICQLLWPGTPVEHKLAQISILICRMKKKFHELGYRDDTIRTIRGKGYSLTGPFHNILTTSKPAANIEQKRNLS
ncbi:winged helix-turn-helix domain-containing protein [Candidatus Enterococcus leclercqii]|uniref:winged helix-turn-helix domain-containing protein n=1 Tax=Candidatus Enterococcus leclercqii TaxID=1857218 RepID=UPI00137ABFAE|nr:winged helix-turn-helix domain-containing protein [Enterococcus sp. CU9D]KAF1293727.1 hypothetical protein BAU14_14020 [Enterococcus sp. CU9D]